MSPFEQQRVLHPFAIVCVGELQFQTYLRWKKLEEYDAERAGDGVRRAVKITSSVWAHEYVKNHGKPGRTLVVLLPMNHVPVGVLPTLGYKRRPDKPPAEKPAEETA